jgi:hypothetical protein
MRVGFKLRSGVNSSLPEARSTGSMQGFVLLPLIASQTTEWAKLGYEYLRPTVI